LSTKGVNIYSNKLFDYFKNEQKQFDGDAILEFVASMKKVSKVYANIETGTYSDFDDDPNMYVLIKLLGIKQFYPILMMFYDADTEKKREVLDSITRLGAAILFSYNQTNSIEKLLPEIISSYYTSYKKDSDEAFKKMIKSFEENTETYAENAKSILTERNHVGKNGGVNTKAATILKFIEIYFNDNQVVKNIPSGKKITVEHILSRSLDVDALGITNDELGFESDKERESYIHRIGNLTLLFNTDNSSLGNGTYEEKEEMYKQSKFIITSTIVEKLTTPVKNGKDTAFFKKINSYEKNYSSENGQWTKAMIDARSSDLAILVYKILTNDFED